MVAPEYFLVFLLYEAFPCNKYCFSKRSIEVISWFVLSHIPIVISWARLFSVIFLIIILSVTVLPLLFHLRDIMTSFPLSFMLNILIISSSSIEEISVPASSVYIICTVSPFVNWIVSFPSPALYWTNVVPLPPFIMSFPLPPANISILFPPFKVSFFDVPTITFVTPFIPVTLFPTWYTPWFFIKFARVCSL